MRNKQYYLMPVLVGGAVAGVLSAMPIVQYGNCIFCLWMLLGAGLAVMLVQNKAQTVDTSEGAIIGALAGVVCAVIHGAGWGAIMALFGASMIPAAARGEIGNDQALASGGMLAAIVVGAFVLMLIIYPLFGALGGLFGALIFKPTLPPPGEGGGRPGSYQPPSDPFGGGGGYGQPPGGFGPPPGGAPPSGGGWGQ